jgi:hypothetical protein
MDGVGAAGTATTYARGDHQHPTCLEAANAGPGGVLYSVSAPIRESVAAVGIWELPTVLGMNKAAAGNLADAFSTSSTYAVGDYVTYEGQLYKCTTAIATAGAWTGDTNWTAVAVTDEMGSGAAYYEIQYLQSTGTQYIDTGVTAGLGVRVVAEVEWDSTAYNDGVFGATNGSTSPNRDRYFVNVASDSTSYVSVGANGSYISPKTSAVALATGVRYTYDYTLTASTATLLINGNSAVSQSGTYSFYESRNIFAFAINDKGASSRFANIKLYSLKIYSGDTLVRDFVPVRSGFDGGLLDKASGTFYTNRGSSAFVLGPDTIPYVPPEVRNLLPIASTTTLDPATAVYRATATLSGTTATMPTVTITDIPTAAAYFAFELEVAVDATATALDDTAWSGWTWMDGGALPTADYAGKTLFIACRLDCTARTIKANCYEVA